MKIRKVKTTPKGRTEFSVEGTERETNAITSMIITVLVVIIIALMAMFFNDPEILKLLQNLL